MTRSASADRRYLELNGTLWRVTIAVPRTRQAALGTRLKRSLGTDSLAEANHRKWEVVAEFRKLIAGSGGSVDARTEEALALAAERLNADDDHLEVLDDEVNRLGEAIQGPSTGTEVDRRTGQEVETFDPDRSAQAAAFAALARGTATPLSLHHELFMEQSHTKRRTKADDLRALKYLTTWCEAHGVSPTVQGVTRKVATRFMDGLSTLAEGLGPVTLNKYLNRLSQYWKWLELREHVALNVWAGLKIRVPEVQQDEKERPFTDDEVLKLLTGPASPEMADLMRVAALTGARLDAIVDLKVAGCEGGMFTFKKQKKEKASRTVPIHTELLPIIERRTAGKLPSDDVFPEWPGPKRVTSLRERSFKTSGDFTAYRRAVKVDETVSGRRRALVNFHSFRRWFITKAEQAGQPENIIATVVGHARPGMTLGRYSGGPLEAQKRVCVEAVQLPRTAPAEVQEPASD